VIYALNQISKQIIDVSVGARTKENVGKVIDTLKGWILTDFYGLG